MENTNANIDQSLRDKQAKEYFESTHKYGRISVAIALVLMLCVPLVITFANKLHVNWPVTGMALLNMAVVFAPLCVSEVFSYAPIIGNVGTYVAFITGNISTMKLPASTAGMRIAGVEPGTEEAEVISGIAICVSSIGTVLILLIGLLFLQPVAEQLKNPVFQPAFQNVMPALVGGLALPSILESPKLFIVPVIACFLYELFLTPIAPMWFYGLTMPLFILISVGAAYFMYKKDMI